MNDCLVCGSMLTERFCRAYDRLRNRPGEEWQVLRCRDCGFGWTFPMPAEDEIQQYYPPGYLGSTREMIREFQTQALQKSRSWKKEVEKVDLLESFASGGRILDVGCAEGKFLWALDSERWRKTGVEVCREVVEEAGRHFQDIRWVSGDIFSSQLEEASFDAATFWHVFEHLHRPREVLARAFELLAPGGWIVLSLPNLESLQAFWFRRHWFAFDDIPRHLFHYSPASLRILLQDARFEIAAQRFFSRIVNFHSWKYTLINWSESRRGNRNAYYLFKPLLFLMPCLERISGRYGMVTMVARKPLVAKESANSGKRKSSKSHGKEAADAAQIDGPACKIRAGEQIWRRSGHGSGETLNGGSAPAQSAPGLFAWRGRKGRIIRLRFPISFLTFETTGIPRVLI